MRRTVAGLVVLTVLATFVVVASSAFAGTSPSVTALSTHRAVYWGGTKVTVTGNNFTGVRAVLFGATRGSRVHVVSPTTLTVVSPWHNRYSTVHLHVVTATGESRAALASQFTFTRPGLSTPIMGGLTARQEQQVSAQVRRRHHTPHTARKHKRWTPAMGRTALRRAKSYLGLPYSWAGGNSRGPTTGVCAHNGGDVDCHVVGFDCSGLALYSWAPYVTLAHHAATQRVQAGRYHPGIGELMPGDLVFFSAYIPNGVGHVAIYAGRGMIIEAAESGTVVHRASLAATIASDGAYRGATRPTSTGRQGPVPVAWSSTSTVSTSGGRITINGRGLASALAVTVGGKVVYSFLKRTPTQVVVAAPAHRAGTVTVGVSTAWGTARRTLRYVAAPSVSALTPAAGSANGGTTVTLTGARLDTATRVTVGSSTVAFRRLSATTLQFVSPPHAPGAVVVTVASPYGVSAARRFTYLAAPPPTVTTSPSAPASTTTAPAPPITPSTTAPSTTAAGTPTPSTTAAGTPTPSTTAAGTPTPGATAGS